MFELKDDCRPAVDAPPPDAVRSRAKLLDKING